MSRCALPASLRAMYPVAINVGAGGIAAADAFEASSRTESRRDSRFSCNDDEGMNDPIDEGNGIGDAAGGAATGPGGAVDCCVFVEGRGGLTIERYGRVTVCDWPLRSDSS
jgi:hypothetical protein